MSPSELDVDLDVDSPDRARARDAALGPRACRAHRARPAEATARAEVLRALEGGRALTSMDGLRDFGTSRLAADIHVLRRMGWPVISTEIEVRNRNGRVVRIATYRLKPEGASSWSG